MNKVVDYANWCVAKDNYKVGKYVKAQATAWLGIYNGKSDVAYINKREWKKVENLLKIIIHPDLNKPMIDSLSDYALFFIFSLLCTYDRRDNKPYYATGLLEIGRKNYKTFTSAVIFIVCLLTKPRFSRLFSVAPDFKLSSELQVAIKKIIKSSPLLVKHFKLLRSEIRCLLTETEYTPLAYSNDKMDGKLAHVFLADEVGAMDTYPVEAMRSSQISLDVKLGIIISTQYPTAENGFLTEVDIAKKILEGTLTLKKPYFSLLYEPDEERIENWQTDDNVIYQANPVAVENNTFFEALIEKRRLAILYDNLRQNLLCKHLNIIYKSLGTESYVDIIDVRKCERIEDLEWWRGREVYLGLDLSMSDDNTALAMVADVDGVIYAKVFCFLPALKVDIKSEKEKVDYKGAIDKGYAYGVGGYIIDYNFIADFVVQLRSKYGVIVRQCGFDRWNAVATVQAIEAKSTIECVEIKQHSSALHPATKLLKESILDGNFRYDANFLLAENFANARCTYDTNLNLYVNKKKSAGKVDMVVALINAVLLIVKKREEENGDFVVMY